jgi:AraC-like DNA-binding protein
MGPLPAQVEMTEGARGLHRLFGRLELPVEITARPTQKILLRDMIALFADAAGLVGDPLLGFKVGSAMSGTDFGPWVHYALSADSLEGCLRRAGRSLQYHQTGSSLTLTREGDLARYTYRLDGPGRLDHRQHGDHVLPSLLSAIRRYAGQSWRPSWLEIKSLGHHGAGTLQDVVGCEVRPRAEALTIVFPAALLPSPVAAGDAFEASRPWRGLRQIARARPPQTLADTVVEIACARMIDRRFDLEGVARKLNLGPRTLQRRLDREGLGYRAILQYVRCRQAHDLLAETDHTVTEIALALGYEDPAHFSRAFRRTTRMPPSHYRQIIRSRL